MRRIPNFAEATSAVVYVIGIIAAVIALVSSAAEARQHHYRYWRSSYHRQAYYPQYYHHRRSRQVYTAAAPAVSAMVVDANTGRTLYARNEDQLRHPASITKVMTLYLLFEALERGEISLNSPIAISEHAAAQPPTKLGLPPGATISVENAIKAIVTESANDIAVAVAEAIAGDESRFAALMTEKARALGMSRTLYRNASGLPNDEQVTTARDLVTLGRAIQERFPREYAFFSTRIFYYDGRAHVNHNHLLGRIDGMDGIKTGYTRSSGFNLLASVRRGGRHVISVVLGGSTAGARDRIMADLLDRNIELASAGPRYAPMIAERPPVQPVAVAANEPGPMPLTPAAPAAAMRVAAAPAPAAVETGAPAARPRLAVVSGAPKTGQADQTGSIRLAADRKRIIIDGSTATETASTTLASYTATPSSTLRWVAGPAPAAVRTVKTNERRLANLDPPAAPSPIAANRVATAPVGKTEIGKSELPKPAQAPVASAPATRSGWMIQIGATDDAGKAADLLNRARSQDRAGLASAQPFTEKVQKGDLTLYRARFAGLEPGEAEAACRWLKRSGFDCFATKN